VIDFHCHLDLYPDPRAVTQECAERGVYVLSVTNTPSAWEGTAALAQGKTRIRTALGLHPQLAHQRKSELPLFQELLPNTRYVGEIGLDGSPEFRNFWADQHAVFKAILSACSEVGGRILSIHSRRAATTVLDVLETARGAGTPILHWFSGTFRELDRAVQLGCWFSVGPAMLATEKGRGLAAKMPRTRLITETDGPFGSIDGRSAMPWDVEMGVTMLAKIWDEPSAAVQAVLDENLRRLGSQCIATDRG